MSDHGTPQPAPSTAHTDPFHDSHESPLQVPPETAPAQQPEPAASATPPPAPVAAPVPAAQAPPPPRDGPVDPRVVALRAMFPDFDDMVLQSVLESVGGDQDRAVDTLLGMSDPDYTSEAPPAAPPMSQTDLDEQLARRLMLEDEQAHQSAWQSQQAQRDAARYEARQSRQAAPQQQVAPGGDKDTMAEISEQFNKIAETGKKTFGTLFNKVKAKVQEFDQQRTAGQSSSRTNTEPRWGSGPAGSGYPTEPLAPPQAQHAYYDPNPQPQSRWEAPTPQLATRPVQGYDATPAPNPVSYSAPAGPPPGAAPAATPSQPQHVPAPQTPAENPATETPRPPQTSSGAPIDAGKLGLLPKRPVSLLRPQSPPTQVERRSSSDDELEYVENPFEERR